MIQRVAATMVLMLIGLASPLSGAESPSGDDASGVEYFEKKIRPVLSERCYQCHGPKKQKGGLRLDSMASILKGGERGPAVVPGDVDSSLLIEAIRYAEDDLKMPPKSKLPDPMIADLSAWVKMGAPAPKDGATIGAVVAAPKKDFNLQERKREHWAFRPIRPVAPPEVSRKEWPRSPIDSFLLAKLEAAKVAPAHAAEKRTLIRRASFDLIGLPPTPAEVESFLADSSPEAFETVVDRLLGSPHFGERWGRHWLDLARYAESKGHEFDYLLPNAYQYRDYVIRAFNSDLPYNQFVTEQIAGDLVQPPRMHPEKKFNESILGTGFWFLGEENHSPVDILADEMDHLDNKIDVMSKTFLGLTVACARCHDHKFDAISTKDYYALSGFLFSSHYRQARFETMEQEKVASRELDALRREHSPRIVRAVADAQRASVAQLADYLLAAREAIRLGPLGDDDILFEDFESETYEGWTATGRAFGTGPVLAAKLPTYQGDVGAHGRGLVNSHSTRYGNAGDDAPIGKLTSEPFLVERGYIRFLIGGGNHKNATCLNLLVDGRIVRQATGHNQNRMQPDSFDVRDLMGKTARLQIVDDESGGWGNIGVDHIVFGNRHRWISDPAKDGHHPSPRLVDLKERLESLAARDGLDPATLGRWVAYLLRAVDDPSDPMNPWAVLALDRNEPTPARFDLLFERIRAEDKTRAISALEARGEETILRFDANYHNIVDSSSYRLTGDWNGEGIAFDLGRNLFGGRLRLSTDPSRPISQIAIASPVTTALAWSSLRLATGTEREAGKLSWNQAGRTLHSPTFILKSGKIFYLVKGSGYAFASVDSHRMINGPLHGALAREWSVGDKWKWIEQDLTPYVGHRVHLEITPKETSNRTSAEKGAGAEEFGLLEILEARTMPEDSEPPNPIVAPLSSNSAPRSPRDLALAYQAIFLEVVEQFGRDWPWNKLNWESFRSGFGKDYIVLADWLLHHPELLPLHDDDSAERVAETARPFMKRQAEIVASVGPDSHTAPTMIDGTGVDQNVLIRGNHRTPGEVVPRRFLEAISGKDQPVIPQGIGSGRLELARRMTDPSNPFLPRVMVNRVWHHLFGRGIVASVDNFGVLGEPPTHPELLDHLASKFMSEGWSTKRLIRSIMLSSAYQMSSKSDEDADRADPRNLLVHRMGLKRMEGEIVRDTILAVSGRLDRTLFGPSVNGALNDFQEGRGRPEPGPLDGNGRRSLYIRVQRNFLNPMFLAFDFPTPFTTIGRRTVSNVPAQALALMNNPFVVEQAKTWADRVLAERSMTDGERIEAMYKAAFSRPPSAVERNDALDFLRTQAQSLGGDAGNRRAWADLAHVLFNVKEFILVD